MQTILNELFDHYNRFVPEAEPLQEIENARESESPTDKSSDPADISINVKTTACDLNRSQAAAFFCILLFYLDVNTIFPL